MAKKHNWNIIRWIFPQIVKWQSNPDKINSEIITQEDSKLTWNGFQNLNRIYLLAKHKDVLCHRNHILPRDIVKASEIKHCPDAIRPLQIDQMQWEREPHTELPNLKPAAKSPVGSVEG